MFTLKNGDGMVWPDGKRIAVMVTLYTAFGNRCLDYA